MKAIHCCHRCGFDCIIVHGKAYHVSDDGSVDTDLDLHHPPIPEDEHGRSYILGGLDDDEAPIERDRDYVASLLHRLLEILEKNRPYRVSEPTDNMLMLEARDYLASNGVPVPNNNTLLIHLSDGNLDEILTDIAEPIRVIYSHFHEAQTSEEQEITTDLVDAYRQKLRRVTFCRGLPDHATKETK